MVKKVVVAGFGFMGMTHTLNILGNKDLELAAVVDARPDLIEGKLNSETGNIFHPTFPFQAGYIAGFENATVSYTTLKGDVIGISDNIKLKDVPAGDIGAGYYNEIEYFAGCLRNNSEPSECTPESSLLSVRLCYEHLKK